MGEVIFQEKVVQKNMKYVISSAGIGALIGRAADPKAVYVMNSRGLDLTQHHARQLTSSMVQKHDLVLVMEKAHIEAVLEIAPFSRGRVHCLGKWGVGNISDPYRKDLKFFKRSNNLIDKGVESWIDRL